MKFVIDQSVLLESLNIIASPATGTNAIPILNCIYINAKKNTIQLSATDNVIYLSTLIKSKVEVDGSTCVFGKQFVDIIRSLSGEIKFELDKKLTISQGKTKINLNTFDPAEFSHKGKEKAKTQLECKSAVLQSILNLVSIAMGTSVGFDINAMMFEITANNNLNVVSTNGKRIAYYKTGKKDKSFLLPAKAVIELTKLLTTTEDITITLTDKEVSFITQQTLLVSSLLVNSYPDFEKVIPPKSTAVLKVDREELLNAVKRSGVLINDKIIDDPIILNFNKDLTVSKLNAIYGDIEDKLKVSYTGEPVMIGFNPRFLIDILEVINDKEVSLEIHGADKPIVYRKDNYVYLALPIKL